MVRKHGRGQTTNSNCRSSKKNSFKAFLIRLLKRGNQWHDENGSMKNSEDLSLLNYGDWKLEAEVTKLSSFEAKCCAK